MNLVNHHGSAIVQTKGMGSSFQTTVEHAESGLVTFASPTQTEEDAIANHARVLMQVEAGTLGAFDTVIVDAIDADDDEVVDPK